MLLNLSNHPSDLWTEQQTKTARQLYGRLIDSPFSNVDPQVHKRIGQSHQIFTYKAAEKTPKYAF